MINKTKQSKKDWYERNKEKVRQKKNLWYQENKEHVLLYNKNWKAKNREKVLEYKRKYRERQKLKKQQDYLNIKVKVNNKIEFITGEVSSGIICKEDITEQQISNFIEVFMKGKTTVVEVLDYLILEYRLLNKKNEKSTITTTKAS